jgi:drug/metabolite transporter (DMT)-like permease
VVLGVFPAALGYATWAYALGHFGAARASNFLYLTPAVATALSIALTGDEVHASTITGGAMVIVGVAYVALRGRR